jgi:hypothetical protein
MSWIPKHILPLAWWYWYWSGSNSRSSIIENINFIKFMRPIFWTGSIPFQAKRNRPARKLRPIGPGGSNFKTRRPEAVESTPLPRRPTPGEEDDPGWRGTWTRPASSTAKCFCACVTYLRAQLAIGRINSNPRPAARPTHRLKWKNNDCCTSRARTHASCIVRSTIFSPSFFFAFLLVFFSPSYFLVLLVQLHLSLLDLVSVPLS